MNLAVNTTIVNEYIIVIPRFQITRAGKMGSSSGPVVSLVALAICCGSVLSSHFRGGIIQFRSVDPTQPGGAVSAILDS